MSSLSVPLIFLSLWYIVYHTYHKYVTCPLFYFASLSKHSFYKIQKKDGTFLFMFEMFSDHIQFSVFPSHVKYGELNPTWLLPLIQTFPPFLLPTSNWFKFLIFFSLCTMWLFFPSKHSAHDQYRGSPRIMFHVLTNTHNTELWVQDSLKRWEYWNVTSALSFFIYVYIGL